MININSPFVFVPRPPKISDALKALNSKITDDVTGNKGTVKAVRRCGGDKDKRFWSNWREYPSDALIHNMYEAIKGRPSHDLEIMTEEGCTFYWQPNPEARRLRVDDFMGPEKPAEDFVQWDMPATLLVMYSQIRHGWKLFTGIGGAAVYVHEETSYMQTYEPEDLKDEVNIAAWDTVVREHKAASKAAANKNRKKKGKKTKKRPRDTEDPTSKEGETPQHTKSPTVEVEDGADRKRARHGESASEAEALQDAKATIEVEATNEVEGADKAKPPTKTKDSRNTVVSLTLETVLTSREAAGTRIPEDINATFIDILFPIAQDAQWIARPGQSHDLNRLIYFLGVDPVIGVHHMSAHSAFYLAKCLKLYTQDEKAKLSTADWLFLRAVAERYHEDNFVHQERYISHLQDCDPNDWPHPLKRDQQREFLRLALSILHDLPARQSSSMRTQEEATAMAAMVYMLCPKKIPETVRKGDPRRYGWRPLDIRRNVVLPVTSPVPRQEVYDVLNYFMDDDAALEAFYRMTKEFEEAEVDSNAYAEHLSLPEHAEYSNLKVNTFNMLSSFAVALEEISKSED